MTTAIHNAALIDAETGGSENYQFMAEADLFAHPAVSIVERFIHHLESSGRLNSPASYQLDSAVKKKNDQFVLATGSLMLAKGEIPFLLMISASRGA